MMKERYRKSLPMLHLWQSDLPLDSSSISHLAWVSSARIDKSGPKTAGFVNPAGAIQVKWEIPDSSFIVHACACRLRHAFIIHQVGTPMAAIWQNSLDKPEPEMLS
jgi:hypothetical protein